MKNFLNLPVLLSKMAVDMYTGSTSPSSLTTPLFPLLGVGGHDPPPPSLSIVCSLLPQTQFFQSLT